MLVADVKAVLMAATSGIVVLTDMLLFLKGQNRKISCLISSFTFNNLLHYTNKTYNENKIQKQITF